MSNKLFRQRKRAVSLSTKVLIVTPEALNYQVCDPTVEFCSLAVLRGIAEWKRLPSRMAELGRNQIMREALEAGRYTHFFLLDSDSFPYELYAIEKLLSHNLPFVAGITPTQRQAKNMVNFYPNGDSYIKLGRIRKMWNVVIEKAGKPYPLRRSWDESKDEMPKSMFKALYVGSTCVLIQRKVLEKIGEPFQLTQFDEKGNMAKSEDYWFCEKIRQAGFDIWINPAIRNGHLQLVDIGNY